MTITIYGTLIVDQTISMQSWDYYAHRVHYSQEEGTSWAQQTIEPISCDTFYTKDRDAAPICGGHNIPN